ncbi:4-hydroxy-tetrahydrodipicolinate synthase [Asticcacaulis machinosus]|uniref:4-hydroxy-tetrahydrodipicolinate synthase n=1 Tax=Asticcacaulis machinosus TaxID=2984211 RepID=A0ABT5HN74_9CAUL|nr:4-hydroxy-tetrahydrodipicolinate synthase [Asticcacaulis machinosus]MDC7677699.1 4-hydroxy-tetrahydrodipicolinate synthase [Asticcacaulis machinosus]
MRLPTNFSGIYTPLITPFKNGAIDHAAAAHLTQHLLDAGIHGVVAGGTTGEGPALTSREKHAVLNTILTVTDGLCPVLVGIEGASTEGVTREVRHFSHTLADGFLVSPPSYVRPCQEGIYRHFMTIAEATDRPIVLYNIPARTGVSMAPETIFRLYETGRFPAIKACGLTLEHLSLLTEMDGLKVLSGDDSWLYLTLQMGGHGGIMASSHLFPDRFVAVYELMQAGRAEEAWGVFDQFRPLIKLMFRDPNPSPVKAALALQGYIHEELRLPLIPVHDDSRQRIRDALNALSGLKAYPAFAQ